MTNSPETFERPVIRSSVTPSLKYSCAGSRLRFENGSTASDGLSGNGSPADSDVRSQRHPAQPLAAEQHQDGKRGRDDSATHGRPARRARDGGPR